MSECKEEKSSSEMTELQEGTPAEIREPERELPDEIKEPDSEVQVEDDAFTFIFFDELQEDLRESANYAAGKITAKLKMVATKAWSKDYSIYRVPEKLRNLKRDAYTPRINVIGPYYGNMQFEAMIEQRCRYMLFFLNRTNDRVKSNKLFNECSKLVFGSVERINRCYTGINLNYSTIMKFMTVDACFILEVFLRYDQQLKNKLADQSTDPIFNNGWMIPSIRRDLALLENQIPFFVLQGLYDLIKPHIISSEPPKSLTTVALQFFQPMSQEEIQEPTSNPEIKHLLDLLHKCYLPSSHFVKHAASDPSVKIHINLTPLKQYYSGLDFSASELVQSGIEFSKQPSDRLANITFIKGVISIPPVVIDETRDSLFRNLIAYEQGGIQSTHHITSYVIVMKTLIRSARDVNLLRKRGIISQNWIEDEEYIAQFKGLLDEVVPKDFYFAGLCDEVNAYAQKFWFRRKMSSFYRKYFSTAWSMTSFIAALCLFALTIVQTYFAINPK